MSLVIGIGLGMGGGCGSNARVSVNFGDDVRKLDPCRVEMFYCQFWLFWGRGKLDANFDGFWSAGL